MWGVAFWDLGQLSLTNENIGVSGDQGEGHNSEQKVEMEMIFELVPHVVRRLDSNLRSMTTKSDRSYNDQQEKRFNAKCAGTIAYL